MEDLQIKVPKGCVEGVVNAHIQAAVMEALGKDPGKLVRAVVDLAMQQKNNSYDRVTLFQETVDKAIRTVATECFNEWLEEQKGEIRKQIRARLTKQVRGKSVADKIVEQLTGELYVSVRLKNVD